MATNGEKPDLSIKPDEIDWRIGSTYEKDNQRWAMLLGYIDSRLAMEKLDLLDPNWSSRMEPIMLGSEAGVRCSLTVNGVTREDVGTASNTEPLKGAFSDALKRAAVHHGIGRELYDLPSIGVKVEVRAGGKTGRPLAFPEWRNGRWTVNSDLGWVRYEHAPKPEKPVTVHVTRDKPVEAARVVSEAPSPSEEVTIDAVLAATGGELVETVEVGPSSVPNVERGGRTAGANDAQVAEVRRLLGELNWGAKAGLGYALNTLEIEGDVPDDGRIARSQFSSLLDGLGSTSIGLLIQKLSNEVELGISARPVTVTP
jgi:hypothetical protein